jgi:hypothetical protein
MSSASSASELLIDSSGAVSTGSTPTDSAEQPGIPAYLRQALQMLDLQPEAEVAKYRAYKAGKAATPTYEKPNPVLAAPDEEDEDYEEIPPSEPFAVMEHARAYNSDSEPAGKLVFKDSEPPAASLDLSMLPPGEISSARNEYLPASQELWRSLGKPAAPGEIPVPKWKLPVAIGSAITAVAAVSGMTYVNLHPTLLQQVPVVAQLTAPPVMPAIPPGQNLAGPDLAMGEFTDLGLGNINSITLPSNAQIAQAPVATATTAPVNTVPPTIQNPAQPTAPSTIQPPVATTTSPTAQTGSTNRLSDTLVRNLLPPNIQQMAGRDVSQPSAPAPQSSVPQSSAPQSSVQTPAPYVPQTPNQPKNKKISDTATNTAPYQVMAKYVNPIGFEKIRTILPDATRAGDRIVLGNFSEKTPAKNLVKKLKQQGIEAWLKNS